MTTSQTSFEEGEFVERAVAFVGEGATWSRFYGRLLPETPALTLGTPVLSFFDGVGGIKLATHISMVNSQIYVLCLTSEFDIQTLRNYVADQVQTVIDCCGLVNSCWFDVDLRCLVTQDERLINFITSYGALAATSIERPIPLDELSRLCSHPELVIALGDMRNAMRSAQDSGLFCYRAVEALMQGSKSASDQDDKVAWNNFNSALNSHHSFIKNKIKKFADARRHGGSSFSISGSDRDGCVVAAATIIFRYCEFLKNKKQPLDQKLFSTLIDEIEKSPK